jgi:hypothetical protein
MSSAQQEKFKATELELIVLFLSLRVARCGFRVSYLFNPHLATRNPQHETRNASINNFWYP